MSPTVYYHNFAGEEEYPAYSNLRVPTLLSIATLRAVNPDIPIVVLDGSKNTILDRWGNYRESLDFQVWGTDFHLQKNWSHIKGWKHLSRLFDLNRHARRGDIIYCDWLVTQANSVSMVTTLDTSTTRKAQRWNSSSKSLKATPSLQWPTCKSEKC
jgi:hypothetical protein